MDTTVPFELLINKFTNNYCPNVIDDRSENLSAPNKEHVAAAPHLDIISNSSHLKTLLYDLASKIISSNSVTPYTLESINLGPQLTLLLGKVREDRTKDIIIIFFYSLIVLASMFGNSLVFNVVCTRWKFRTATHVFIANLAASDLLMTILNIPFNLARILLDHWPFGTFMCSFVPLIQVTSVYVSTFTMLCIAFDRYYVITNPLQPRMRSPWAFATITLVWGLSVMFSLPEASFYEISEVLTYRTLIRCRLNYPEGYRKYVTLSLFMLQYLLPLSITGIVYGKIISKVWSRQVVGAVTLEQVMMQSRMKLKTIKMLVTVVIVFAICWLPLNLYHLLIDFDASTHNSTAFFICHWLAMSSVCYNPFIYCWLNDSFRAGAKTWGNCLCQVSHFLATGPSSSENRSRSDKNGSTTASLWTQSQPTSYRNTRRCTDGVTASESLDSFTIPTRKVVLGTRV